MKERDNSVDVAKGFGILLVLLGHLSIMWTNPDFKYIFHAIYSFHMPMFVILSGFFFIQEVGLLTMFIRLLKHLQCLI